MLRSDDATTKNDIFIFEDDSLLSHVMSFELSENGCEVATFHDGRGVDLVDERRPSLIVLDLSLDNTDAVEVIQSLSQCGHRCPVQLVSGGRIEMLERVRRIGERRGLTMLPPLQKPFSIADLTVVMDVATRLSSMDGTPASVSRADRSAPVVDLGTALDNGWVEVWYQPKYDMKTIALVGAECLCRVRHPEHGLFGPASFLPGASIDDMRRLTEFILRRSCEDWTSFDSAGCALRLAINIPCSLLTSMPLAKLLRQWRPEAKGWIGPVLEVTEEEAMQDIDAAHEVGTQLALYGVDLSIDDFGTGYSSLARLQDIPFKEIKLDRSLVDGCVDDRTRATLCRTIIDLSHALGAKTVAEGVERADDFAFLRDIGCDTAQGYLLARPMTRDALVVLIAEGDASFERLGHGRGLASAA